MPILNFRLDGRGRPVVELYVGVGAAEWEVRAESGLTLPGALRIDALLDTGASRTLVAREILDALGLLPVRETDVFTASTGWHPLSAGLYVVSLSWAGEVTGALDPNVQVAAGDGLGGLGVQALVGRDVLSRALLVYNGPRGEFTLALGPP
jgi:predicted aspartyl protease